MSDEHGVVILSATDSGHTPIPAPSSQLPAPGSKLPAPGSQLFYSVLPTPGFLVKFPPLTQSNL
jgi:hypothetical protein